MIRSVPANAQFTFRRRMGDASALATFNPISAGVSAGVSLATTAASLWMNSIQLSHNADTATTLIVNGLAQQLQNLLNAYMSEPPSCANQRAALNAYDNAWMWLQGPQACGAPSYGSAGNRCISDRAPGGPYPWQSYYRDPIANDPRVASLGCDTGQEVILPSLTTQGYTDTGVTNTGGSSSTGQTAAQIAAAALAAAGGTSSIGAPAPAATTGLDLSTITSSPNFWLYAGLGVGALILAKSL
jgi:hypothetical protein